MCSFNTSIYRWSYFHLPAFLDLRLRVFFRLVVFTVRSHHWMIFGTAVSGSWMGFHQDQIWIMVVSRPGRKHGFLGYRGFYFSNFYKSVFSIFTRQIFENPRFSNIRLFDIHNR